MSVPSSTNGQGGERLQGKGLDPGQVPAGALPTQQLPITNQTTPENFIQIGPSVEKLIMILQIIDESCLYHIRAEIFNTQFLLPFHSLHQLALLTHSVLFRIMFSVGFVKQQRVLICHSRITNFNFLEFGIFHFIKCHYILSFISYSI